MFKHLAFASIPVFALTLALAPARPGGEACRRAAEAESRWSGDEMDEQIFFAVLEGLYRDGVPNGVVDAIIVKDPVHGYPANFVWSCPLCMPAYKAFLTYRARPTFEFEKAGDQRPNKLDSASVARMTSGAIGPRQTAIMELVARWVGRRADSLRLNDQERARWQQNMEERRKKGMAILGDYKARNLGGSYAEMKSCPFCDGANDPFERR